MAISKWNSLKAYEPTINFWLQFNPTFLANKITSHLIHQIFLRQAPIASEPSESILKHCWEKIAAAGAAIEQIASRHGLIRQRFEKLPGKARFDSFDQIFEHVHQGLFDSQKYRENLASGKSALQNSSYMDAKRFFSKCLKASQGSNLNYEREAAVCFAEAYLQEAQKVASEEGKKKLIKAAGLFNYALNIAKKEKNHPEIDAICLRLKATEENLFSLAQKPFFYDENCHENNRSILREIRTEIEQKMPQDSHSIADIQEILEMTTTKMKAFSADLLSQALASLGDAPCTFAMIGFGSLARGEMTPYSDLEFAFLIDDEKYAPFFRDLTYLLHFKVLCLGETILPALGISSLRGFTDCITARGFAFDGAGVKGKGHKTPLGCPPSFELIHTPKEMAAFQGKKGDSERYWFEEEPHLPMELQQYTWITGNDAEKLAKNYGAAIELILNQPYKDITLRGYMSKQLLASEDYNTYFPDLQISGGFVNVKRELYRLPHLFLQRLCLFHQIKEGTSWEKIGTLENRGIIQPKIAERFKELFAITIWYRFSTYMHFKAQNENKNPLILQAQNQPQMQEQHTLNEDLQNLPQIIHLYSILIPMLKMMSHFCTGKFLDNEDLCDRSNATLGIIYTRLMQVKKAKKHLALAIKDQPKDLNVLLNFLFLLFNLDEHKKAVYIINPLLESFESSGIKKMSKAVACCYLIRGKINKARGQVKEAIRTFQLISGAFDPKTPEENLIIHMLNGELGEIYTSLGNILESKKYYLKSIQVVRESLSDFPALKAHALMVSGVIRLEQEEYDIAIDYFKRALVIHRQVLGDNHLDSFICLESLCRTYRCKKDFTSCIALAKHSLKKIQAVHVTNLTAQIQVRLSAFSQELGMAYLEMGDEKKEQNFEWEARMNYAKAVAVLEKTMLEDKRMFGEKHEYVGSDLINLGQAYGKIGNFEKSITRLEEAVNIYITTKSDFSFQLSLALSNLGINLQEKGNSEKNGDTKAFLERALACFNFSNELLKVNCPNRSDKIAANLISITFVYAFLENIQELKKSLLLAVKEAEKLSSKHPVRLYILSAYNKLRLASDF